MSQSQPGFHAWQWVYTPVLAIIPLCCFCHLKRKYFVSALVMYMFFQEKLMGDLVMAFTGQIYFIDHPNYKNDQITQETWL